MLTQLLGHLTTPRAPFSSVLCPPFRYNPSVYHLLHILVPAALAYFRNAPPPPGKEMHPLRKMHKGIQKEGTTTHGTINLIAVSISVQVHLGTYADINIHYFLM